MVRWWRVFPGEKKEKESIWIINALASCRVLFRKKCISPITTPATALSSQWYRSHTALRNFFVNFFQPLLTNHANNQHRGCVICYPVFISVWQERSISISFISIYSRQQHWFAHGMRDSNTFFVGANVLFSFLLTDVLICLKRILIQPMWDMLSWHEIWRRPSLTLQLLSQIWLLNICIRQNQSNAW